MTNKFTRTQIHWSCRAEILQPSLERDRETAKLFFPQMKQKKDVLTLYYMIIIDLQGRNNNRGMKWISKIKATICQERETLQKTRGG
jgi:hypothetical protein